MPELGTLTGSRAASLAGLAPVTRESDSYKGRSFIQGGRHHVRRMLYMSALVAIRCSPDLKLKRKYETLVAKGKPPKVALTAVMRKLLVLANTLVQPAGPHLDDASATRILLPCLPDALPGEWRSRMIDLGKNGRRSGGMARDDASQVASRKTGIHLTWILPGVGYRVLQQSVCWILLGRWLAHRLLHAWVTEPREGMTDQQWLAWCERWRGRKPICAQRGAAGVVGVGGESRAGRIP